MADIRDTGDAVSGGDNGGFGNEGAPRRSVGGERHHHNDSHIGADELPEHQLIGAVLERLSHERYDCRLVDVDRVGRRIVLFGAVESADALEVIESIARGVPGVVAVDNELVVDAEALQRL